jgi:DNA-binding response OmpR family regulator
LARILSVSYDATLLHTRELLLVSEGHDVVSALGFHRGAEACRSGSFDLFILGHSIPQEDKLDLIGYFRQSNPPSARNCAHSSERIAPERSGSIP